MNIVGSKEDRNAKTDKRLQRSVCGKHRQTIHKTRKGRRKVDTTAIQNQGNAKNTDAFASIADESRHKEQLYNILLRE